MESRRWLEELRETFLVPRPVELATVNDDACGIRTRDAEPLGCGCDDNVCSVINRPKKKASCPGRVVPAEVVSGRSLYSKCLYIHHQRHPCFVSYSGQILDVGHQKFGT